MAKVADVRFDSYSKRNCYDIAFHNEKERGAFELKFNKRFESPQVKAEKHESISNMEKVVFTSQINKDEVKKHIGRIL